MCRTGAISILAATLLAAGSAQANAKANYCVRPVPVAASEQIGLPPQGAGIVSRRSQSVFPNYIKLATGSDYPIAYDSYTYEKADGQRLNRNVFWSLSVQGQLTGPYDPGFIIKTGGVESRSMPSDRTLLIGGRYVGHGPGVGAYGADGRKWQTRLFEAVAGDVPRLTDAAVQNEIEWPENASWSDLLNGFLVSSRISRDEYTYTSRSSLLRDGVVTPLGDRGIGLATDLPHRGVVAILKSSGLGFLDRSGQFENVSPLNSGDDYNGWEALHETSDEGWLYVDGAQYDHAIKVEKDGKKWRAGTIIRVSDEIGILDWVMRMLLGMDEDQMERDRLAEIVRVGSCRKFSKAIGRMIFCDRMEELRAGELHPIDSPVELTHFLGDIEDLGLAIFRGEDASLYSYDGKAIRQVQGETADRGLVEALPETRRAFLTTRSAAFEIRGDDAETLELVRLDIPGSDDLFFTRFREAPDGLGTISFTRRGIYLVEGLVLTPLWMPGEDTQIDITGHTTPTQVKGWKGILFTTRQNVEGPAQFHLLTLCDN